jgi:hypothetical protein
MMNWIEVEEHYMGSDKDCVPQSARDWTRFIEQVEFANQFVEAGYPSETFGLFIGSKLFPVSFDFGVSKHESRRELYETCRSAMCLGYGYKKSVYEFITDMDRKDWKGPSLDNAAKLMIHVRMCFEGWGLDVWGLNEGYVQPPAIIMHDRTIVHLQEHRAPSFVTQLAVGFGGECDLSETDAVNLCANVRTTSLSVRSARKIVAENSDVENVRCGSRVGLISMNSCKIRSLRNLPAADTVYLENCPVESLDGLLEMNPKNIWLDEQKVPARVSEKYKVSYTDSVLGKTSKRTMKLSRKSR